MAGSRRRSLGTCTLVVCIGVLSAFAGSAAGADLSGTNATVAPGETAEVPIELAATPAGLSGYTVTVEVDDAGVASVANATYPDAFAMTSQPAIEDGSVTLRAVDVGRSVEPGATDVRLATVVVRGEAPGETALRVAVRQVDDDDGDPADVEPVPTVVRVGGEADGDAAVDASDGSGAPSVLGGGGTVSPIAVLVVGLGLALGVRHIRARRE